ncbi:CHAT domain-containing protein [Microbispora sp. NPDC088329]|uniref:CHAT domain-containing protein n=1 Tax=Microbispora sp. NPDC088329 TaxID=3154869 RepID=UPI003441DD5F
MDTFRHTQSGSLNEMFKTAATTPVMVAFHERLAAGRPPAAALAEAQRAVRGDDPRTAAAAAGFVCIGAVRCPDGDARRGWN